MQMHRQHYQAGYRRGPSKRLRWQANNAATIVSRGSMHLRQNPGKGIKNQTPYP